MGELTLEELKMAFRSVPYDVRHINQKWKLFQSILRLFDEEGEGFIRVQSFRVSRYIFYSTSTYQVSKKSVVFREVYAES